MKTKQILLLHIVWIISIQCFSQVNQQQKILDSLKTVLYESSEIKRVDILNQISKKFEHYIPDSSLFYAEHAELLAAELYYNLGRALANLNKGNYYTWTNDFQKATEAYNIAIELYDEEHDKDGLLKCYNNKGNMYRISGDYDQALRNFLESLKYSEEIGDQKGIAYASLNIGLIYANLLGESESIGLPYFLKSLEICREIDDLICISYSLNNIALVYVNLQMYDSALYYHHQSLELRKNSDDYSGIASSLSNISDIYTLQHDYETALDYNQQALNIYREINDIQGIVYTLLDLGRVYIFLGRYKEAEPCLLEGLSISEEYNSLQLKSGSYHYLYEYYKAQNEFEKALDYYIKFTSVQDSIYSENSSQQIAEMRTIYETEKKEAAITQLTNEKTIQDLKLKKSENLKLSFIGAAVLTFLLAIFAYYGYRQKRNANSFLKERNKLEGENRRRAINLFGQQVSKEVAKELLSDSFKSQSKKLSACIMFLDIRDFTPFAENKEPSAIIKYQNDVFGFMIDIISKHHGIINQFLGDGFMATFGAPASSGNDSQNAVNASIEIIDSLKKKCKAGEIPRTKVGIGLHSGNIVTGNVGTAERKQYSITGNTVILASRIEQLNKKFDSEVLISKEVLERLDQANIKTNNLGDVNLKGRIEPFEIHQIV